jgi:hypothetical protein
MSTGVHDPLQCAALYLRDGAGGAALILANDLIFISRALAATVRQRLAAATGVPAAAIMVTATHTHSGPVTVDYLCCGDDPVVPPADPRYLEFVAGRMVEAGVAAMRAAEPAEVGLAVAHATGVGGNRHDPAGPRDADVPVLLVRSCTRRQPLACMLVYAMHPTVLHEDSTLISADFPHFTRAWLRASGALPPACPILYHTGAAGNQSPRHHTRGNTLAEARRLGEQLGMAIAAVIPDITCTSCAPLQVRTHTIALQPRMLPSLAEAEQREHAARTHLAALRASGAPGPQVRTAECDWFGATETVVLARAAATGRLAAAIAGCSPASIQLLAIGPWRFIAWPGEIFVEYALDLRARDPHSFVITLANGELQGYIVTPEAAARGCYEAANAVFAPDNGRRLVEASSALLKAPAAADVAGRGLAE